MPLRGITGNFGQLDRCATREITMARDISITIVADDSAFRKAIDGLIIAQHPDYGADEYHNARLVHASCFPVRSGNRGQLDPIEAV